MPDQEGSDCGRDPKRIASRGELAFGSGCVSFSTGDSDHQKDEVSQMEEPVVEGEEDGGGDFALSRLGHGATIRGESVRTEVSEQQHPEKMEDADDDALRPVDYEHRSEIPILYERDDDGDQVAEKDSNSGESTGLGHLGSFRMGWRESHLGRGG